MFGFEPPKRSILLVFLVACMTLPSLADHDSVTHLPVSHATINHDLEGLLITHSQLVGEIRRDNLSLLEASLHYHQKTAWKDFLISMFVSFVAIKGPATTATLYLSNIKRVSIAATAKRPMKLLRLKGPTAKSTLIGLGGSVVLGTVYISTNLFQQGVCIFSCVESFSTRILEKKDTDFLRSETFQQMENELGEDLALRYYTVIKTMRDKNFSTFQPLHNFLLLEVGVDPKSVFEFEMEGAPVFSETIRIFAHVFNLKALVSSYLEAQPEVRYYRQNCQSNDCT